MTATRRLELKHSVLKLDLDFKPPEEWFREWLRTRLIILRAEGLKATKTCIHPTERGYHIWIHLNKPIPYEEQIKLQFLLGDDHQRAYFNQQRMGFTRFRSLFNILFEHKRQLTEEERRIETPQIHPQRNQR